MPVGLLDKSLSFIPDILPLLITFCWGRLSLIITFCCKWLAFQLVKEMDMKRPKDLKHIKQMDLLHFISQPSQRTQFISYWQQWIFGKISRKLNLMRLVMVYFAKANRTWRHGRFQTNLWLECTSVRIDQCTHPTKNGSLYPEATANSYLSHSSAHQSLEIYSVQNEWLKSVCKPVQPIFFFPSSSNFLSVVFLLHPFWCYKPLWIYIG